MELMELLLLMSGLALVVFTAVLRRTGSESARPAPAVPTTLVCDRAIARSMLVDHADVFSHRPASAFPVMFVGAERVNVSHGISTVPHGPLWRALRRNLTAGVLHPSRLGLVAGLQRDAVDNLVASLLSSGGGDGGVNVAVRGSLHTAVLSILMRMCFGGDGVGGAGVRAVQRVLNDFFDGMVDAPVLAGSRAARLLHWRRWRRLLTVRSRMVELLLPLIAERRRRRSLQSSSSGAGGFRPYVDALLDVEVPDYDDESVRRALTDDEKVTLVWEFVGAGTETIVSCVEWTLAHLVDKPEVQEKLRRELAVDDDTPPSPYLRAVILESLRLHPPVAFIQRDIVVAKATGTDGGTAVAAVIDAHVSAPEKEVDAGGGLVRFTVLPGAIGRDGRVWRDPDEFRPERFLAGGEGEAVGATPGPRDIRMMPFGAGTRHCPGMGLALVHVRLLLAALVRAFRWELPPAAGGGGGGGRVDLTEVDGFVKHMKTPLMARITPRT